MIDYDDLVWMTKEDFIEQISRRQQAVRDLLNDIDTLVAAYVNSRNLTKQEVAEYLRCDPTSIPKDIPSAHIGRNWIYRQADVDKWLKENTRSKRDLPKPLY
jgi:hypothetical protein